MKEFASRGTEFLPLRAVHYYIENQIYHIRLLPLNVAILITHVRYCVMGATPMVERLSGICESKRKGHSFQGNRGTKAALGNGEHIFFLF